MIWKRMSAVFFVIVAVHADGGNDFSNTLLRVQAEEPAGRIIFVKTTPQRRRNYYVIRQQNSLSPSTIPLSGLTRLRKNIWNRCRKFSPIKSKKKLKVN